MGGRVVFVLAVVFLLVAALVSWALLPPDYFGVYR